jgi:hypothetical protein
MAARLQSPDDWLGTPQKFCRNAVAAPLLRELEVLKIFRQCYLRFILSEFV